MQRVGRQAARQCVAAAAHSDSLTMLSLLCPAGWSCGSDHNHGPAGGHWAAGSSFTGRLVLPSRGEATGAAAGASAPARRKAHKRPTASVAPQRVWSNTGEEKVMRHWLGIPKRNVRESIGEMGYFGQHFHRGAPPHTPRWGVAPDPTGALPQTPS